MISNEMREALQQVAASLNRNEVDYMLIGGVAVSFYGYQRGTMITFVKPEMKTGLDFWYKPTNENFVKLVKALGELEVDTSNLEKIIFDPKKTFLKIPHKTFHTDFIPEMIGLRPYRECRIDATAHKLDGNDLIILGYKDLIANKITLNRRVDKTDIQELESYKKKKDESKGLGL